MRAARASRSMNAVEGGHRHSLAPTIARTRHRERHSSGSKHCCIHLLWCGICSEGKRLASHSRRKYLCLTFPISARCEHAISDRPVRIASRMRLRLEICCENKQNIVFNIYYHFIGEKENERLKEVRRGVNLFANIALCVGQSRKCTWRETKCENYVVVVQQYFDNRKRKLISL